MKLRRILLIVLSLSLVLCAVLLAACKLQDVDMSGVKFEDKTVEYDGTAKALEITGSLPEGVTVAYEYYKDGVKVSEAKDAGVYTVKALFTVDTEIYNPVADMTATLTISYNLSGISLADKSFVYDGTVKTLQITGTLPTGVTVAYEYYKGDVKVAEAKNAGTYKVVAKFTGTTSIADKEATLTIAKADIDFSVVAKQHLDAESNKPADLETPVVLNKDGTDYTIQYDAKRFMLSVEATEGIDVDEVFTFYNTKGANGELSGQDPDAIMDQVGYHLYLEVKFDGNENYNAVDTTCTITMLPKTVEISNWEELQQLRTDRLAPTEEHPEYKGYGPEYRMNMRYVLTADIDANGAVWQVVDTIFGATGLPFCSEFDGNGYAISNFKITNDSIPDENKDDQNGWHIGFFGYVTDAYIHNLTFDGVTVTITRDGYVRQPLNGGNCVNPINFGLVAARLESDNSNGGESDIENITIKNSSFSLHGYKFYAGIFIGQDHAKTEGRKRNNLVAENVELYTMSSFENADDVFLGGIVGSTQGNDVIEYKDCILIDIKLGYDQAKWNEQFLKDGQVNNEYNTNFGANNYVGAFIGRANGTSITFTNCHLKGNWRMTGNNIGGYFGRAATYPATGVLHITDCTHTNMIREENGVVNQEVGMHWAAMAIGKWEEIYEPAQGEVEA